MTDSSSSQRGLAWLVHIFTASGAACGFLALERAVAQDFVSTFLWLAVALVIDGIDGTFARAARVREVLPIIDGDTLDLVVDFLTYVVVPVVVLVHAPLLPRPWALTLAVIVLIASALYFADGRMKTPDNWFRGFPAIWNVLVFYLLVFQPTAPVTALIVLVAVVLMFAPIVFIHPMRVKRLQWLTGAVLLAGTVAAGLELVTNFAGPWWGRVVLLISAAYVILLPLTRGSVWAESKTVKE